MIPLFQKVDHFLAFLDIQNQIALHSLTKFFKGRKNLEHSALREVSELGKFRALTWPRKK